MASETSIPDATYAFTAFPTLYQSFRHLTVGMFNNPIDVQNNRSLFGSMLNFCYHDNKRNWWGEISVAPEKEFVSLKGTTSLSSSHFGLDDSLFTIGYDYYPCQDIEILPYLTGGIPGTRRISLRDIFEPLVGTRCYALAQGVELVANLLRWEKSKCDFIFQERLAHFFKRKYAPLLPEDAKFARGNQTDFLFTVQYGTSKHFLEIGYNPTFYTNQEVIVPFTPTIKSPGYITHSPYFIYLYTAERLPLLNCSGSIGLSGWIVFANNPTFWANGLWLIFNLTF
ncbi:MAG: hypothetical protein WCE21_01340 [Candidatus Babeliales bacterium]